MEIFIIFILNISFVKLLFYNHLDAFHIPKCAHQITNTERQTKLQNKYLSISYLHREACLILCLRMPFKIMISWFHNFKNT